MKGYKLIIFLSFLFSALLLTTGCDDSSTGGDDSNRADANQLAQAGFDLMNVKAQELENKDMDNVDEGEDVFAESDYNSIKTLFDTALDKDSDNPMAHLGLAILELFSINYDPDLWALINDVDTKLSKNRIMNHQLQFLGSAPAVLLKYTSGMLKSPSEALSFARVQELIEDNVIPKLDNAISHLDYAIDLADSNAIVLEIDEDEFIEIDPGEIYLFRASLNAVEAGFRLLILYDVDLFDDQNSYDWIDNFQDVTYYYGWNTWDEYQYVNVGTSSYLYLRDYQRPESEIHNDSLLIAILKHNMLQRTSFLTHRRAAIAPDMKTNILNVISDMEDAITYIENESDDQSDDIIKFEYIQEANNSFSNMPTDAPAFMQNWQDMHDVLDWLDGLLTDTYTFTVDQISFDINMGRMFDPGLEDLKDYLPYHTWYENDAWLNTELNYTWTFSNYGSSYSFYLKDQTSEITVDSVDFVVEEYFDRYMEPVVFVDGPAGAEIDPDEVMPYFPDHTFNGIFPDMTRDKMHDLFYMDE